MWLQIVIIFICLLCLVFLILSVSKFLRKKKEKPSTLQIESNQKESLHYCFKIKREKNYEPDEWQVFFVSAVEDEKMTNFFEQHLEEIQKIFETEFDPKYTQNKPLSFVYLPRAIDEQYVRELISYCRPDVQDMDLSCLNHDFIGKLNSYFLQKMYDVTQIHQQAGICRTELIDADAIDFSQGFIHYKKTSYHDTGETDDTYSLYPLHYESDEQMFRTIRDYVQNTAVPDRIRFRRTLYTIDDLGEKEQKVAQEILERMEKLRCWGLNNLILNQILFPEIQLSHLKITSNYQLILVDYQEKEIKMPTLSKTLYFLYLRHPEGIPFKMLSDYKQELYDIYNRITTRSDTEALQGSIERLVDATENSINEKCSRIRSAFVQVVDDTIAQHYYITTDNKTHSLNKLICLDRSLIIDESGISK